MKKQSFGEKFSKCFMFETLVFGGMVMLASAIPTSAACAIGICFNMFR